MQSDTRRCTMPHVALHQTANGIVCFKLRQEEGQQTLACDGTESDDLGGEGCRVEGAEERHDGGRLPQGLHVEELGWSEGGEEERATFTTVFNLGS